VTDNEGLRYARITSLVDSHSTIDRREPAVPSLPGLFLNPGFCGIVYFDLFRRETGM
jgi:hypothetical protein